jgi:ferredoxin
MKVHRLARYSGAVKNIYGCIPGGTKQLYHKLFQGRSDYKEFWGIPLVDVYESVRPGLNILDAVYGLDEDGPAANGEPKFTGLILLSDNAAALDLVACRIMDFDSGWIPALREAINRGLVKEDKIKTIGEVPVIPYVKLPDEEPPSGVFKKVDDYFFDQLIVEPRLDADKCSRCGICIRDCAVSAISSGDDGYPVFNHGVCIRCYCCSEYCPQRAIHLHGSAVNHIIRGIRSIMKI